MGIRPVGTPHGLLLIVFTTNFSQIVFRIWTSRFGTFISTINGFIWEGNTEGIYSTKSGYQWMQSRRAKEIIPKRGPVCGNFMLLRK